VLLEEQTNKAIFCNLGQGCLVDKAAKTKLTMPNKYQARTHFRFSIDAAEASNLQKTLTDLIGKGFNPLIEISYDLSDSKRRNQIYTYITKYIAVPFDGIRDEHSVIIFKPDVLHYILDRFRKIYQEGDVISVKILVQY